MGSGAEVMTFDDDLSPSSGNTKARTLRKLATMKQNAQVDHRSTLQRFKETAERVFTQLDEEEEVQSMMVARKVEKRKKQRAAPPRLQSTDGQPVSVRQFKGVALAQLPEDEEVHAPEQERRESPLGGRWAPASLGVEGIEEDDQSR